MDKTNELREKAAWHRPEIVDVGGVLETTTNTTENVRDNPGEEPQKYNLNRISSVAEVEL